MLNVPYLMRKCRDDQAVYPSSGHLEASDKTRSWFPHAPATDNDRAQPRFAATPTSRTSLNCHLVI
jgi:hypothetical protein